MRGGFRSLAFTRGVFRFIQKAPPPPSFALQSVESHGAPALLLELLPEGLDPLPVDVAVALADPRGAPVLDRLRALARREPELHVIDEPESGGLVLDVEVVVRLLDDRGREPVGLGRLDDALELAHGLIPGHGLPHPPPVLGAVVPARNVVAHVVRGLGGRDAVFRRGAQRQALDAAAVVRHAQSLRSGSGAKGEERPEEQPRSGWGPQNQVPALAKGERGAVR